MARALQAFRGELVAWLIGNVPAAVWAPDKLPRDLNPFDAARHESEAMRRHKEEWRIARQRAAFRAGG